MNSIKFLRYSGTFLISLIMIEPNSRQFFEISQSSHKLFLSNITKAQLQNTNSSDSFNKRNRHFFNALIQTNQRAQKSNRLHTIKSSNASIFKVLSEPVCKKNDSSPNKVIILPTTQHNLNVFQNIFEEIFSFAIKFKDALKVLVNTSFLQVVHNSQLSLLFTKFSKNLLVVIQNSQNNDEIQKSIEFRSQDFEKILNNLPNSNETFLCNAVTHFVSNQLFTQDNGELFISRLRSYLTTIIGIFSVGCLSLIENNLSSTLLNHRIKFLNDLEIKAIFARSYQLLQIFKSAFIGEEINKLAIEQAIPDHVSSNPEASNIMDELIEQYIQEQSSSPIASKLNQSHYSNDLHLANDLLNSIIKQTNENLPLLDNLVNNLYFAGCFTEEQLKVAFFNITSVNETNENIGKALVHIYSLLIVDEILSFDDFEEMFFPMKNIWSMLIPYFFTDIDQRLGTWVDDMSESKFWNELQFIDSSSNIDIMEKLKAWNIIDLFPEFDIAYTFFERLNTSSDPSVILQTSDKMTINHEKLMQIIFDIVSSLKESQMEKIAQKLKTWFSPYSNKLFTTSKFTNNAQKLFILLQ